jgi:hypothetical protein
MNHICKVQAILLNGGNSNEWKMGIKNKWGF